LLLIKEYLVKKDKISEIEEEKLILKGSQVDFPKLAFNREDPKKIDENFDNINIESEV